MRNKLFFGVLFVCMGLASCKVAQWAGADWIYKKDIDKMTSDTSHIGYVICKQPLCNSAVRGDVVPYLMLDNSDGINYFVVSLNGGQFAAAASPVDVKLRFDTAPAEEHSFYYTDDIAKSAVCVSGTNANKLIEKLRQAKHLYVEAELYPFGDQVMEFHVAALRWKYIGKDTVIDGNSPGFISTSVTVSGNGKASVSASVNAGSSNASSTGSGNKNAVSSSVDINVATHTVIVHCIYKNSGAQAEKVSLKVYFLDAGGNVLAVKTAAVTCPGNTQAGAALAYDNKDGKYNSYRIEVQ